MIADSGSTKTDWVKVTYDVDTPGESSTHTGRGLNPHVLDCEEIEREMLYAADYLGHEYDKILFFGSGVGDKETADTMRHYLRRVFDCSDINVDGDMAAAAIALLGDRPGIACIMGTGSNSCHYNGKEIDRQSVSLGFILDDNGGGVSFGRRLLADIFKGIAPEEIRKEFNSRFHLSESDVLEHLYHRPAPNRWIASFMPFILEHKTHPYISMLIAMQLEYFFDREFIGFSEFELKEEGIAFTGSISALLEREIRRNLDARGWKIRNIVAKPMELLLQRYTAQ